MNVCSGFVVSSVIRGVASNKIWSIARSKNIIYQVCRPLFFRQMAIIIFSNEELLLVACQLDCIGDESSNNQPDVISWRHSVVMSQVSRVTPRYSGYPGQWPSSEQVLTNKTQLRARSIKRQKIRQRKLLCSPKLIFLAGHSWLIVVTTFSLH